MAVNLPVQIIVSAIDQATQPLKQVGASIGRAGDNFADFQKNALIASAGITAVGVAAFKLASDAGRFESVKDAFTGMTRDMIDNQDAFVKKVKDASAGTLSSMDVMSGATKALALIGKDSFTDFGSDFSKMAELSKKAARATGQDVDFMFQSLITGVARSSKLILDNLGITLDMAAAQSKYKDEIMATTGVSEIQAEKSSLLRAAIEELDNVYKDVSVTSGGLQGAQQKLKATFEDMRIEIGTQLMPIFNQLTRDAFLPFAQDTLPKVAAGLNSMVQGFLSLAPEVQKLILGLTVLLPALVAIGGVVKILTATFLAYKAIVIGVVTVIGGMSIGLVVAIAAIIGAGVLLIQHWDEIKGAAATLGKWVTDTANYIRDNWQQIFKIDIPKIMGEMIAKVLSAVANFTLQLLADMMTLPYRIEKAIWDNREAIISTFSDIFKSAMEGVKAWLQHGIDEIKNWPNRVRDALSNAASSIKSFVGGFAGSFKIDMPKFATGGVVPGPIGQPRLAVVHGGEQITPTPQIGGPRGAAAGGGVTLNVYVGMYAGTESERRSIAEKLWDDIGKVAKSQQKSPLELLPVTQ